MHIHMRVVGNRLPQNREGERVSVYICVFGCVRVCVSERERERIDFYSEQARKFNMNEKEKLAAAADVMASNHVMLDLWPTLNSNKQVRISFTSLQY